jgi:hypothetical protein
MLLMLDLFLELVVLENNPQVLDPFLGLKTVSGFKVEDSLTLEGSWSNNREAVSRIRF